MELRLFSTSKQMFLFALLVFPFTCSLISMEWLKGEWFKQSSVYPFDLQHRCKDKYELEGLLKRQAVNNTIFLMITDYGYLDHFINAYYGGSLSQYRNLIVACLDSLSYHVYLIILSSHSIYKE